MPLTAKDLIETRQPPTTVKPSEPVSKALGLMIEHDFSQLPVVDDDERPKGLITSDSMLRALSNFGVTLEKLRVRDAIDKYRAFNSEVGIFDLLETLEFYPAVLIVNPEGKLTGIVTNWDTAEYFRRRAEDLMLVEDIETHLKEHIQAAFAEMNNSSPETSDLQIAINEVSNAQTFYTAKIAVTKYLSRLEAQSIKFNLGMFDELCQAHLADNNKSLQDMTLVQLTDLFLHKSHWESYGANFGPGDQALRKMLKEVRIIRNTLAHFRDELTPGQREALRFCAGWFERNPPISPKLEATALVELGSLKLEAAALVELSSSSEPEITPEGEQQDEGDSRYARLALYLQNLPRDSVTLSFKQIEEVLGVPLPPSSKLHRSWWANDSVGHVQSKQWLDAGWRVGSINMTEETITFVRAKEREKLYIAFFSELLGQLRERADFDIKENSPKGIGWHQIGEFRDREGKQVAILAFTFAKTSRFRVELYIDSGDETWNKDIFAKLASQVEENAPESIESVKKTWWQFAANDGGVQFERLDNRRASRVAIYKHGAITDPAHQLEQLREWAIPTMISFQEMVVNLMRDEGFEYSAR